MKWLLIEKDQNLVLLGNLNLISFYNLFFFFVMILYYIQLFIICSAIKDGYESDGALVFKRRESQNTPRSQTPAEAKTAYNQIQKGI